MIFGDKKDLIVVSITKNDLPQNIVSLLEDLTNGIFVKQGEDFEKVYFYFRPKPSESH
jgi:hypothetical protein